MLLAVLGAPAHASGIEVVDDAGHRIVLEKPARRIVSLAPHATEILFAAGAGPYLVGAVNYSDYPEEARQIPRLGGYDSPDLERIVALKPDLVVAWQSGNPPAPLERLRALGLTVYVSEPRRIEDIPRHVEQLGRLAGTDAQARRAAGALRERHARLERHYAQRPVVSVFYQIWHRPLMTVNDEHLISQVIQLCGGRNVFAKLPLLAPKIDIEAVLAADPEVIVASGMDEARPEWLDDWRSFPQLTAVRRGNLFFVPPDLIQRHGPRILEGAERLCEALEQARGL